MEAHNVVLVTGHDAVLTDSPTGSQIACKAAIEVSHGIRVLLRDSEQTFALPLCHVQCDPVTILFVPYNNGILIMLLYNRYVKIQLGEV